MDGPDRKAEVCRRCGKCCLEAFSRHVAPEDFGRWEREGRFDLIASAREEEQSLDRDGFVAYKRFKPCRFLNRQSDDRTDCGIYDLRPRMCREFTPGRSRLCPAGKDGG